MKEEDIISLLNDNSDAENKAKLIEWANSSDENREEYYRIKNLLALTGSTAGTIKVSDQQLTDLMQKISKSKKTKMRQLVYQVSKYAAVIMITFFIARIVFTDTYRKDGDQKWLEISTQSGQTAEMLLPDGTKVWLNALTNIQYPSNFSASNREVKITGEAFFKVKHDENSPFVVRTNNYSVKVLGTSFNVTAYQNDAYSKTTLVEGKIVLLNAEDKEIKTLVPGQLFSFNNNDQRYQVSQVSTNYYTSWKDGYFAFDQEKLESIAAKLERIYAVKITIPEAKVKGYSFTGTIMKNKPLEQILRIIELTAPIKVTVNRISDKEDQVTIVSKN